jgi:hypothetical protein
VATEIRMFDITIPAGTPSTAPLVSAMRFPPRTVEELEILVPPGPRGEVGFRIGAAGTQLIPIQLGGWIVTDNEIVHWPLSEQHDSGSWEFTGYNTGLHAHTVTVRFLLSLSRAGRADGVQPIPAGDLAGGAPGSFVPPPIEVPPPPTLTLPPPPELPPLPELPPPLGIGDLPGPGPARPQPSYNWWYDAMGRLLTYPDQANTTRFDEVFVMQDGSVGWYAWQGGAGSWQGYNKPAGSLGGNFVDVSAAFTLYGGVIRLNIVGTAADGTRSLKVMNAQDFQVIADWSVQPAAQSRELAASKRAGGA